MAATSISEKLFKVLSKIDRPGTFCAQGNVPAVLPGLEIGDLGPIGFPLTTAQAKEIKKHCQQAPYGKGELTLVDTKVRRVWQMTPDQFELTNPDWSKFLAQTIKTVQHELGLEKQKFEAHLYNLLLYEKGSFFLPHRDGEKLDRMVATLVVVLPSAYEGGELVIRHEGQERTLDFGSGQDRSFRTHFAAFYADCAHEVRPLTAGYRLCLVYNLTLAKAKKPIRAPRAAEHIEAVRDVLRDWAADDAADSPRKLAVTLEHQYTQDGLTWDALKGVDRAKAQVLREAAGQAGCKAYLALLTFWESGSAVEDGSNYYGRRRRWYKDDHDEDDAGGHEMGEVIDSSLTADHWSDDEGHRPKLGAMSVEETEVVPEESLKDVEPEENFEGYTGNAGMTLERWYRHAAILLWPEKRHFEVLARGSQNPVAALAMLVNKWQQAGSKNRDALKAQCLDFTRHVLASWPAHPYAGYGGKPEKSELAPALAALDDPQLIRAFLSDVMAKDFAAETTAALLKACDKHGWSTFQDALVSLFKSTTAASLPRNVRVLEQLCTGKPKNPERIELCGKVAEQAITALEVIDREKDDWRSDQLNRQEVLAGLVRSLIAAGQGQSLARLLAHISATPKKYPLSGIQLETLVGLRSWLDKHLDKPCAPLSEWLADCRGQLESLTGQPPRAPADFRRDAKISCDCPICQELTRFLKDPQEKEHRFPLRKDRRQHLHETIDRHQLDLEHVTDRRGSPQTLVCTKNTATYHRRVRQYEVDKEHLAAVRALEASLRR